MAEIKITELNELSLAELNDNDVLPIVDVSDDETKKIKALNIKPKLKDEYSNSTIEGYCCDFINDYIYPVELYSSTGTTSTITLSDSAANYKLIVIQAHDNEGIKYSDAVCYEPDGKTLDMSKTLDQYCKLGRLSISGTSISFVLNQEYNSKNENTTFGTYCIVTKVIGYK